MGLPLLRQLLRTMTTPLQPLQGRQQRQQQRLQRLRLQLKRLQQVHLPPPLALPLAQVLQSLRHHHHQQQLLLQLSPKLSLIHI